MFYYVSTRKNLCFNQKSKPGCMQHHGHETINVDNNDATTMVVIDGRGEGADAYANVNVDASMSM